MWAAVHAVPHPTHAPPPRGAAAPCAVCDPVMGDEGNMYVTQELLAAFRETIVPLADVLVRGPGRCGAATMTYAPPPPPEVAPLLSPHLPADSWARRQS